MLVKRRQSSERCGLLCGWAVIVDEHVSRDHEEAHGGALESVEEGQGRDAGSGDGDHELGSSANARRALLLR